MYAREIIQELNSMPLYIGCRPQLIMELKANEDVAKNLGVIHKDGSIQVGPVIFYPHNRST